MKNKQALTFFITSPMILLIVLFTMCDQKQNKMTYIMLHKDKFTPDTTFKTQFPWDDVIACFDDRLTSENYTNHDKCPKCKRNSEKLVWIEFRSPDWTWKNLCGRQGPLSICPNCNIQVEFITEIMN